MRSIFLNSLVIIMVVSLCYLIVSFNGDKKQDIDLANTEFHLIVNRISLCEPCFNFVNKSFSDYHESLTFYFTNESHQSYKELSNRFEFSDKDIDYKINDFMWLDKFNLILLQKSVDLNNRLTYKILRVY